MKKIIAVILALSMLAAPACAEGEISYTVPEGWTRLNAESLDSLVEALSSLEELAGGASVDDIRSQYELIIEMGMEMSMSSDFNSNLCVVKEASDYADTAAIYADRESVIADYEGYASLGAEITNPGEIKTVGGREFFFVSATMFGENLEQYMFVEGATLATFTFTNAAPEAIVAVLESVMIA